MHKVNREASEEICVVLRKKQNGVFGQGEGRGKIQRYT